MQVNMDVLFERMLRELNSLLTYPEWLPLESFQISFYAEKLQYFSKKFNKLTVIYDGKLLPDRRKLQSEFDTLFDGMLVKVNKLLIYPDWLSTERSQISLHYNKLKSLYDEFQRCIITNQVLVYLKLSLLLAEIMLSRSFVRLNLIDSPDLARVGDLSSIKSPTKIQGRQKKNVIPKTDPSFILTRTNLKKQRAEFRLNFTI